MTPSAAVWLVLLLSAVGANLPFLNERFLLAGPALRPKSVGVRLLEMGLYLGLVIVIGTMLEARAGQAQTQGWQFYATMVCVFLTLAFPGFVWRYLRKHRAGRDA